jgi:hypothetical protein
MYKTLHFCQQGTFGNFVYLVSKKTIRGLTDQHTHFQFITCLRLTSAKYLKWETKKRYSALLLPKNWQGIYLSNLCTPPLMPVNNISYMFDSSASSATHRHWIHTIVKLQKRKLKNSNFWNLNLQWPRWRMTGETILYILQARFEKPAKKCT